MDTRRRSPEQRESTDSSTSQPDTGSETKVVKLTDLEPVGRIGGSARQAIVVAIVAVALVAFAAGAAMQSSNPTPSPSAGPLAAGSPGATAAPSPTPTPRPTPTPLVVPTTPKPSNAHPWTWDRMDIGLNLRAVPEQNMWGVGDHVVFLGATSDDLDRAQWELASINTGFGWRTYAVPPAITDIDGETVIDDHLWFMGLVSGVSASEDTWQLVGTTNGETWESIGPTDGFGAISGPASGSGSGFGFLGRVGDTWVVDVDEAGVPSRLFWSDDGRHWQPATMPKRAGQVELVESTRFRDRMLVRGWTFIDFDHVESFILSSSDGRDWEEVGPALPGGASISGLTCNLDTCVVTEDPLDDESTLRTLWVTDDGMSWAKVSLDLPMAGSGSPIRLIRATSSGFIAIAGFSDTALLSRDGRTWRLIDGIRPAIATENLANLAVADDLVIGFGVSGSSEIPDALWRGSLAAMEAAP